MEIIRVTEENLEKEHICCAISNNKDCQVAAKKAWLSERFKEGLVFLKGDVRGKCFIEYIPAENAWAPVEADGYMYVDCLWVSGQFKGHGYSNLLLEECIKDSKSKGKKGLVILSSKKKMPYLADKKYLTYKGFQTADRAEPYFELMYLPFDEKQEIPRLKERSRIPSEEAEGFVLYYSGQCPFTAKYVPAVERIAQEKKVPFRTIQFKTTEQAQKGPALWTTYSLFFNGDFVTNEIMSEKKFEKLLVDNGLNR